jgi:hypothetical protein
MGIRNGDLESSQRRFGRTEATGAVSVVARDLAFLAKTRGLSPRFVHSLLLDDSAIEFMVLLDLLSSTVLGKSLADLCERTGIC